MKNKSFLLSISLLFGLLMHVSVQADIAVVVHPDNKASITQSEVRRMFLGKQKAFSDGETVQTFDLPEGNAARSAFTKKVLRKAEARLNAYWARMLFSSKARPPKVLNNADEVKGVVSNNVYAIAYLDSSDVDSSVRVVFSVSE